MMVTALTGYGPAAVSPESMRPSVPSRTALATSLDSAWVGRGWVHMDSKICVEITTTFPLRLQRAIIIFCARKTFSGGIFMPSSPRATMMPSLSMQIASKFLRPSSFSILEMILILRPRSPRVLRMVFTSSGVCTKEAATKSTPCGIANFSKSFLSLSCNIGKLIFTPGKTQFLRSPSLQLFITSVITHVSPHSFTVKVSEPSATRMVPPGFTVFGNCSYDSAMQVLSPLKL
mmetsp:Transcript_9629/g.27866  ORF Transcript_9629/g.27866 Transcript_9629/m.27866 type:complete len:232 (+) Transcript_9629:607-1302(+)